MRNVVHMYRFIENRCARVRLGATTLRVAFVAAFFNLMFPVAASAQTAGDYAIQMAGQTNQIAQLIKVGAALGGLILVAWGIYGFAVLHRRDPREHSLGRYIGMIVGGGILVGVVFFAGNISTTIFGTAHNSGLSQLGVGY